MKIVMGNIAQSTSDATTVTITTSTSDPVPTCQFSIIDNTSSLQALAMQEILILDDIAIPNPTINQLLNPILNPYGTSWIVATPSAGVTYSQNGGGGIIITFSNNADVGIVSRVLQQIPLVVGGQIYISSMTVIASSPVNIRFGFRLSWLDANSASISDSTSSQFTPTGVATRYSYAATAPASAAFCIVRFYIYVTSSTNSGSMTWTNLQFEPEWFTTQSYPTPFCGPSQTNCRQLPVGYYIRQARKFAGLVTNAEYGDYKGNVRTIRVTASGYAFLLSTIYSNKSYTNQNDSAIITDLLTTYVTTTDPQTQVTSNLASTTNVVQGVQLSNFQLNWDDLRTAFNNLASQIGWYWSIDYYWNAIYAPPGYFSATFSLIADNSSVPDNATTFPVQNFKATMDATQPGSNILVLGNGSNTAQVIDPTQIYNWGFRSGSFLPTTSSWMRKVNESSLNSTTDCTNRGIAEILQYDYERYIYTLTTDNVELLPGYGVQVTSATDNLNKTTLLIQQVKATWTGKNEFLADVWIYDATLGAINRNVASILSRLFRLSNSNTSAVAIASTTLVAFERLGVTDGPPTTSSAASGYQATILADTPLAYYRLDELLGTIADDFSGNANAGTLHGGVTLNATGLLHSGGDPAMSFNGTSGYISLPTTLIPTGSQHAWSLECWCRVSSLPTNQWNAMVAMGNRNNNNFAGLFMNNTASVYKFDLGLFGADVFSSAQFTANTTYHVVGTFDGTNARLYVNASLAGGPTAATVSLATNFASIGSDGSSPVEFYPGTIDEVAVYNYALSSTQISDHYTVGST